MYGSSRLDVVDLRTACLKYFHVVPILLKICFNYRESYALSERSLYDKFYYLYSASSPLVMIFEYDRVPVFENCTWNKICDHTHGTIEKMKHISHVIFKTFCNVWFYIQLYMFVILINLNVCVHIWILWVKGIKVIIIKDFMYMKSNSRCNVMHILYFFQLAISVLK